jgi:pyruvate kinase
MPEAVGSEDLTQRAVEGALASGVVKNGDLIIITAGLPLGVKGTTNLIKVHTVADVLAQGTGIGRQPVTGRARLVLSEDDLDAVQPGEILVTRFTDAAYVPAMERAAGIVTEEGGLTSHAAVAGISLGKPVIVGAAEATRRIADGAVITLDVAHGLVLRGEATVR